MLAELIENVTAVLGEPVKRTTVAEQYANSNNYEREVQAYAKIAGKDWTYYVKTLNVSIGRNTTPASSTGEAPDNKDDVNIDLGPAKVVSRRHASIDYNMSLGIWELNIEGRNGAKVNFTRVQAGPGSPSIKLVSGTIIDIGGTQMMFILPDSPPTLTPNSIKHIQNKISPDHILYKLGLPRPPIHEQMHGNNPSLSSINFSGNGTVPVQNADARTMGTLYNQYGQKNGNDASKQSLAAQQQTLLTHQFAANGSTMGIIDPGFTAFQNEVSSDLSKPENKNVKPPYSYATLITQAILSTEEGEMSLANIYAHISSNFSYYQTGTSGWQNSIRHNLSLNKAFEKVPRREGEPGKGMKWRVAESFQREFLEKYREGKVSKLKRGSSVVRQLQLHISKFGSLPIERTDFRTNGNFQSKSNEAGNSANTTSKLKHERVDNDQSSNEVQFDESAGNNGEQNASKKAKLSKTRNEQQLTNSTYPNYQQQNQNNYFQQNQANHEQHQPYMETTGNQNNPDQTLWTNPTQHQEQDQQRSVAQAMDSSNSSSNASGSTNQNIPSYSRSQQPQYQAPLQFNSQKVLLSPAKRPASLNTISISGGQHSYSKPSSANNSPTRSGNPLLNVNPLLQQLQPQYSQSGNALQMPKNLSEGQDSSIDNDTAQDSNLKSPSSKLFSISAVEAYTPERGSTLQQVGCEHRRQSSDALKLVSNYPPQHTQTNNRTGEGINDTATSFNRSTTPLHGSGSLLPPPPTGVSRGGKINNGTKNLSADTNTENNLDNLEANAPENGNSNTPVFLQPTPNLKYTNNQQNNNANNVNNNNNKDLNGLPNPQSSPGVWNLLQFSSLNNTPAGRSHSVHPLSERKNSNLGASNGVSGRDDTDASTITGKENHDEPSTLNNNEHATNTKEVPTIEVSRDAGGACNDNNDDNDQQAAGYASSPLKRKATLDAAGDESLSKRVMLDPSSVIVSTAKDGR
ncbi:hypothetical protein ACO0RG_001160 [Hanseniaspora osmophila]